MAELSGYTGKIAQVDLTTGEISTLNTFDYAPKYIGARGIGARIHWEMVGPSVQGTDPENVISFITSPTTGTPTPGGQRICVTGTAPHLWPVQSYMKSTCGGMFAPELKYAGWDGIVIKGVSQTPVYILIQDEKIEIRDATYLWGLDTLACEHSLWDRLDDKHRIMVIGQAGENLVADAVILSDDSNCVGKGGFGAVMGSKKCKAIAVRGTGSVSIARPDELLELAYEGQRYVTRKEGEDMPPHPYRGSLYGPLSTVGNDIWKEGQEGKTVRTGFAGCMLCPIACGMSVKFLDGSYESTGHIMCTECNSEPEEMTYNNENWGRTTWARLKEQDKVGYNQWAMHLDIWPLFTYGLLKPEDLEIDAPLGSKEFGRQLVHKLAYREGLGDELAKGRAHFLNEFIGTDAAKLMYQMQAVASGKSRLTYNYGANFYGPVGWVGCCVERGRNNDLTWVIANCITDPRVVIAGSDKWAALMTRISLQFWGSEQGFLDSATRVFGDYTAAMAKTAHNTKLWYDTVGCCSQYMPHVSMYTEDNLGDRSNYYRMFSAVTGLDIPTYEDQQVYCDRIWMLERCIQAAQGQNKEDDWLFDCIFEDASYKDFGLSREALRTAIDQYYEIRGIDVETGIPRRSTLEALDLKDVADKLEGEYGIALPA
jgi:aldehyde:ferredoxin oxidoreductase